MIRGKDAMRWWAAAAMIVASPATAQARLDHVAINVTDQARSIAFYAGAFGLKEIATPLGKGPGTPRWMALSNGVQLHLQARPEKVVPPPRVVHFALAVDDLDRVMAWLKAHGHSWSDFRGTPGAIKDDRSDGVRQIFVQDPDGYWIEVNAPGRR